MCVLLMMPFWIQNHFYDFYDIERRLKVIVTDLRSAHYSEILNSLHFIGILLLHCKIHTTRKKISHFIFFYLVNVSCGEKVSKFFS